ncbi:autotransporter adhesin, partial [Bartonella silvatica]
MKKISTILIVENVSTSRLSDRWFLMKVLFLAMAVMFLSHVSPVNSSTVVRNGGGNRPASEKNFIAGNNSAALDFIATVGSGIKVHKVDEKGKKHSASSFQQGVEKQRFDAVVAFETLLAKNIVPIDVRATALNAASTGVYTTALGPNDLNLFNKNNNVTLRTLSPQTRTFGITGYDPFTGRASTDRGIAWQNTSGIFPAGVAVAGLTKQVVGVAAGWKDTDAVNVAQLKALREKVLQVEKGAGSGNFSSANNNLKITTKKVNNSTNVTFTLSNDLTLNSIKLGGNILNVNGLVLTGGPRITNAGIDAGNNRISGVATGWKDTDAVNVAQLKALEKSIGNGGSGWSLVAVGDITQNDPTVIVDVNSKDPLVVQNDSNIRISGKAGGIKISLNDAITVKNVNLGKTILSEFGLRLGSGPSITTDGINAGGKRITAVASGNVSDNSTDAVNGSQLYRFGSDVAKSLGGGAGYKNGAWTDPTFKIKQFGENGTSQNETYRDVASAFAGVGKSFENVNNRFTDVVNNFDKKIKDITSSVQDDALLWDNDKGAFVAQHGADKSNSKITSLEAGSISKDSSDAVTGSQLYATNENVKGVSDDLQTVAKHTSKYLGGGADVLKGTEPTYKVQDKAYHNVSDAFGGVDTSITDLQGQVAKNKDEVSERLQDALLWDDGKGAFVAQHGADKSNSKITSLAAGDISKDSSDAVTGSQLYATNENVQGVSDDLQTVAKNASKYLGGGADVLKGAEPTYNVQDKAYHNVSDAFGGVDTSITDLQGQVAKNKDEVSERLQDALLWDDGKGAFVAQHGADKSNSKITSLAAGDISKDSSDAVTGSQLYATNENVQGVSDDLQTVAKNASKYLGGGADVLKGAEPTYNVQDKAYHNVSDAFGGVDTSITDLQGQVAKNKDEVSERFQDALLWDDGKGAFVATHGADKSNSKITSLEAGNISKDSSDAVTGSQLYTLGSGVAQSLGGGAGYDSEGKWQAPHFTVKTFGEDGSEGSKSYDSVADALGGVNNSFKGLNNQIADVRDSILVTQGYDYDNVLKNNKALRSGPIYIAKTVGGTEAIFLNNEGETRILSGVTDGKLAKGSTEVVTGSQLYETNENVKDVADNLEAVAKNASEYLGGDADVLKGTEPTYNVQDKAYHNVSDAFGGVDASITDLQGQVAKNKDEVSERLQDALLWDDGKGAFVATHGADKSNSKITSLAAGDISKDSTDAVIGSQLYATNENVKGVSDDLQTVAKNASKYLGGGADVLEGTEPTYKLDDKEYHDISGAFGGVDKGFKDLKDQVAQNKDEVSERLQDALLWDDGKGAFVATHGADKSNSKITSLAAGDISKDSTDAVTGSQLYATNENVKGVSDDLQTVAKNASKYLGGG